MNTLSTYNGYELNVLTNMKNWERMYRYEKEKFKSNIGTGIVARNVNGNNNACRRYN